MSMQCSVQVRVFAKQDTSWDQTVSAFLALPRALLAQALRPRVSPAVPTLISCRVLVNATPDTVSMPTESVLQ